MENGAVNSENLVSIENLTFSRGDKKIFDNISFDIAKHHVTAIMGPSGTGKTTLLRLIGGELRPDSGCIHVDGQQVHKLRRKQLFSLRKRIGMLFQSGALLTDQNVFDNVAFPLREHTKLPESIIRKLVLIKLEAVGLRGAKGLFPNQLSGGMARRVALARAIALDPMMIMYDEPFTGQDPISMGVLVKLIRNLNDALGLTSIIVSHDVEETAAIADKILVMAEGKIIGEGTPEEILMSGSQRITQFMNGLPDGPVPFHHKAPDYSQDLFGSAN